MSNPYTIVYVLKHAESNLYVTPGYNYVMNPVTALHYSDLETAQRATGNYHAKHIVEAFRLFWEKVNYAEPA